MSSCIRLPAFCVMLSFVSIGHGQVCWHQYEQKACSSFPITDFALAVPFAGAAGAPQRHLDLATNLGWRFKTNARVALGPAFFFSAYLNGGWHSQWGLHGRVCMRLQEKWQLQISPGVIISDSPFPNGFAGYHAQVDVMYTEWVGLIARLDRVRVYPVGYDTIVQIGMKAGSYVGMGATALGAVAGGIAYLAGKID